MFKYVIVVLALIAAVFAAPKPQFLYTPTAYSAYNTYAAPAAATVYSSNAYVPAAYSAYAPAAATYSAYAPLTYL
ncbi:uncharacterized protein LOC128726694 [Anopheles nili]|uniref:uncharacterized protein LOC128726694 n=1 Tax=Anopheles nili TaxID=185578 RepID=UPI00237C1D86|nr:uncharacterized protein LOC128726694 [Anopheles nili]